jgi:hypothetical protein
VKAAVFEAQVSAGGVEDELHGAEGLELRAEGKERDVRPYDNCSLLGFNPCFDASQLKIIKTT